MPTEDRSRTPPFFARARVFGSWLRFMVAIVLSGLPTPGGATVRVGAETEVRSIRFTGVHSIRENQLLALIQTQDRVPAFRLRAFLGKLPLVPPPPRFEFHPRVLQEDVVRLRNKYAASGFLGTQVRYEVQRVGDEDLLDIRFLIEEGTPIRVTGVRVDAADRTGALPIPGDQQESWRGMEKKAHRMIGRRLDALEVLGRRNAIQQWWLDRGFPQAEVSGLVERDSLRSEARVRFVIDAGRRSQFGTITVHGNRSISDHVVLRELPFQSGDFYSEEAILKGRRDLQQLQIIRAVRVEASSPTSGDSSLVDVTGAVPPSALSVAVTITEAKPRVLSGQFGYVTDAGISSEANWNHRNFIGGARVLTLSALAQTGLWAVADNPDLRYRGTVSLQQPHVLHRRVSGVVSPFVEYREDLGERSLEVGSNVTLVYRPYQYLMGSLDYRISTRKIYEYRLGDLAAGNVDLLTFLARILQGELSGNQSRVESSLLTFSATVNTLDEVTNPRSGVFVRPDLQVTAPTAWSSASYWRANCTANGFLPLTQRSILVTRVAAGRLFPFGKSLPSSEDVVTESILQLRDASFTAGGSADVRGWGHRMLGPKFPDIRFTEEGDSLVAHADGYVPLGGFSRVSFSLELDLPLPVLGPNFGWHAFLDGGRVWTQDERFNAGGDRFEQQRFFYATGAGLNLLTPVGAIRFSLGYKINPSLLDLVDSEDLLRALDDENALNQLKKHSSRRWQFHFAIGSSF